MLCERQRLFLGILRSSGMPNCLSQVGDRSLGRTELEEDAAAVDVGLGELHRVSEGPNRVAEGVQGFGGATATKEEKGKLALHDAAGLGIQSVDLEGVPTQSERTLDVAGLVRVERADSPRLEHRSRGVTAAARAELEQPSRGIEPPGGERRYTTAMEILR